MPVLRAWYRTWDIASFLFLLLSLFSLVIIILILNLASVWNNKACFWSQKWKLTRNNNAEQATDCEQMTKIWNSCSGLGSNSCRVVIFSHNGMVLYYSTNSIWDLDQDLLGQFPWKAATLENHHRKPKGSGFLLLRIGRKVKVDARRSLFYLEIFHTEDFAK